MNYTFAVFVILSESESRSASVILSNERSEASKDPYSSSNLFLERGSHRLFISGTTEVGSLGAVVLDTEASENVTE